MINKNNRMLTAGAVVFKRLDNKKVQWFLVKNSDEDSWEIPKTAVRKGESSVRAALRMMGEQAGMTTRILEEAGRYSATAAVNGKMMPKQFIYYLLLYKSSGEVLAFDNYLWFDFGKAVKKLASKKEQDMLRKAKEELDKWIKERQKKKS